MKMSFEWDEEKARTNLKKHRVSFDEDNRRTLPQHAQTGLFCLSGSSGLAGLTKQTRQTK
jgi:hypothetical protein